MTLDATKPTDQEQVQAIAEYIRENRVAINALIAGGAEVTITSLNLSTGTVTLAVGTDLTAIAIEIVLISGVGMSTLANITGGSNGQIKILVFQDGNIDLTDGVKSDGKFYLNQLPALSNFDSDKDDVLALLNIGGNGSTNNGYWKELFRLLSIK